jgi:hypothetical protein
MLARRAAVWPVSGSVRNLSMAAVCTGAARGRLAQQQRALACGCRRTALPIQGKSCAGVGSTNGLFVLLLWRDGAWRGVAWQDTDWQVATERGGQHRKRVLGQRSRDGYFGRLGARATLTPDGRLGNPADHLPKIVAGREDACPPVGLIPPVVDWSARLMAYIAPGGPQKRGKARPTIRR